MQLGTHRLNLPSAPPAPEPPREAPPAPDHSEVRSREEAFERALSEELSRKDLPEPRQIWAPAAQSMLAEESAEAIAAAEAAAAAGLFKPRQPMPVMSWNAGRPKAEAGEAVAPVPEATGGSSEEITILVEPGLPQVQPIIGQTKPVPLVEFPQVVVGQVRQMQKDNQPITQLDFEISPPHIGPVNLQIALQNGSVNVQLVALTMQAKQALENQVGQIQSILQSHAITPGQIKVVTASSGRGSAGANGKGDQPSHFGFSHGGRKRGSSSEDIAIQA